MVPLWRSQEEVLRSRRRSGWWAPAVLLLVSVTAVAWEWHVVQAVVWQHSDESLCWMSEGLRLYEKCVKMRIWQTGTGLSTAEKIRVYSHLLFSYEQGKKKAALGSNSRFDECSLQVYDNDDHLCDSKSKAEMLPTHIVVNQKGR